jgi:hypothetical protein
MTTTRLLTLAILLALAGCDKPAYVQDWGADQCQRRELFLACMKALPAGPQSTHYNDWDEVVKQCDSAAYYQSLRKLVHIKPECQI